MFASKDAPAAIMKACGLRLRRGAPRRSKDFEGAAGVVRFADGAVEAEVTAKGLPGGVGGVRADGGPDVSTLPGTTAAALSVAFREGWLRDYLDQMNDVLGGVSRSTRPSRRGSGSPGCSCPRTSRRCSARGVTVSVDGGADLKALAESPDPSRVPAGMRIYGDPSRSPRSSTS